MPSPPAPLRTGNGSRHDAVVRAIQEKAHSRGLLSHYCARSVTCAGDKGLPDLIIAGTYLLAFIEVKTPGSPSLSSGQRTWRHALLAAGELYEVMTGEDLAPGGAVDQILVFICTPPPASEYSHAASRWRAAAMEVTPE